MGKSLIMITKGSWLKVKLWRDRAYAFVGHLYSIFLYIWAGKALARLFLCGASPEPSLVNYAPYCVYVSWEARTRLYLCVDSFHLCSILCVCEQGKTFGDKAVMQIYTMCGIETGIIILIGSLRCLKKAKTTDKILGLSVNLILFSLFSVTYVVDTHWNCLIEAIPIV